MDEILSVSELPELLITTMRKIHARRGAINEELWQNLIVGIYRYAEENDDANPEPRMIHYVRDFFRRHNITTKTLIKHLRQDEWETELKSSELPVKERKLVEFVVDVFKIKKEDFEAKANIARRLPLRDQVELTSEPSKTKLSNPNSSLNVCMCLSFSRTPVTVEPTDAGRYFAEWNAKTFPYNNITALLTEGSYTTKEVKLPDYIESAGGNVSALSMFPALFHKPRFIVPNRNGKPELALRVAKGFHAKPPVTVEWKTFPEVGIEELLQASSGALQASYFPEPGQSWLFFEKPPFGFGTLYCGPTAIAVFVYEMVGFLMFSVFDSGSSLGSPQYNKTMSAIASIELSSRSPPLDLSSHESQFSNCSTIGAKARWAAHGINGKFYKILRYDRFRGLVVPEGADDGYYWRKLFHVYQCYGQVLGNGEAERPAALVQARLLYGEYQVLVEMDYCGEGFHHASSDRLKETEVQTLVQALDWLLLRGLCYTDFREANVLVDGKGSLRLIDYDDMSVHDDTTAAIAAYHEVLNDLEQKSHIEFMQSVMEAIGTLLESRNVRR